MPSRVARFAEFELDSGRYELRRGDRVLKLEKIPMELLILLAESSGQLVTRDQIIERIWGKGVFLDTEHGINTAIRKIRLALGDDSEQPRFVQTVTGKGYRFIVPPIEIGESSTSPVIVTSPSAASAPTAIDAGTSLPRRSRWPRFSILALASALALGFAFFAYFGWRRANAIPSSNARHVMLAVLPFENLSGNPNEDYFSDGLTEELIAQLGALRPDRLA